MRIVGITDIHGNVSAPGPTEGALREADLVLVSGDITHFGGRREAASVLDRLMRINPRLYAVSGNCDRGEVAAYLSEQGVSLEGACAREEELLLAGSGGSLPAPAGTPNERSEQEFERILSGLVRCLDGETPLVLVSHQPPRGTVNDRLGSGRHVGSDAVRRFIEMHGPAACLCGHIHEGVGIDRIGGSIIVNPGPFHQGGVCVLELEGGRLRSVCIMRRGERIAREKA
jgi:hypothetical protein